MKILVCAKHAASVRGELAFTSDCRAVDPDYLVFALDECDACGVEAALRLREQAGGEVVVVTAGDMAADASVRRCLAMGADRAIRTWSEDLREADVLACAAAVAEVVRSEAPDLILCGVQSSDGRNGAFGTALAALLGLPCLTCAIELAFDPTNAIVRVRRELEGGLVELAHIGLPAVLTIQSGINEPRYPTFRAIKQAEQKPLAVVSPATALRRGSTLRQLGAPQRESGAAMLAGEPAEIGSRLAAILKEQLR